MGRLNADIRKRLHPGASAVATMSVSQREWHRVRRHARALAAGLFWASFAVSAQSPASAGIVVAGPEPVATPAAAPEAAESVEACCLLADGTIVQVEIAETINSRTAQRGQSFRLRLSDPLQHDGLTLLPAGTEGIGEIIHADRARVGGKAGELLLAARSLQAPDGRSIPLRGLKLGAVGKDQGDKVLAAILAVGVIGMAVHGGEVEVAMGTPAQAKVAGPLTLPPLQAAPAADVPIMEPTSPAKAEAAGEHPDGDTGQDMPDTHLP